MSLYDLLGVNDTDGIDPDEVEAIKKTLTRLQVVAAGFAKNHDTTDTLAFLMGLVRMTGQLVANPSLAGSLPQQATNTSAHPTAAIGGGGGTDPNEDLKRAMKSLGATDGQLHAALRLLSSGPDKIVVTPDGTPQDQARAESERDSLREELDQARNPNKRDSLAWQLAEEQEAHLQTMRDLRNARGFDKPAAKSQAQKVLDTIHAQKGKMRGAVEGRGEAIQELTKLFQVIGL